MKALLIAGEDASEAARWALDAGAAEAESPIGRYAGALALLVLGRDEEAAEIAATLGEGFPSDVADALRALAAHEEDAYRAAVDSIRRSFETREAFLEEVPVPDTALSTATSAPCAWAAAVTAGMSAISRAGLVGDSNQSIRRRHTRRRRRRCR